MEKVFIFPIADSSIYDHYMVEGCDAECALADWESCASRLFGETDLSHMEPSRRNQAH